MSEAWDLLSHLPKWALSDKYDIQARIDQPNPTKDRIRDMMRSLLEKRFALRTHRESLQREVLALKMKTSRFGPQFQKHISGRPCSGQESLSRELAITTAATQLLGKWPNVCEGDQIVSAHHTRAGVQNQNMDNIAAWLTGEGDTDLPIVNQTGLKGTYDLIIDFAPEHGPSTSDSSFPTFAEALQDQLGLVLKKQKGAATVFIIDHLERPSDN